MVATWRSMAFTAIGSRPMSASDVEGQVTACEALGEAAGPGRLVEIVHIDTGVPLPRGDVRAALEAGAERMGPWYAAVGTIFESPGFRGMAVRGVLRSLMLASPVHFEQRVFSKTRPCAEWVLPIAQAAALPAFGVPELLEAISFLRGEGQKAGLLHTPRGAGG